MPVDVQNNDDLGASIGLENDDDLFLWNVTFEGPESSLYEVSTTCSELTNRHFEQVFALTKMMSELLHRNNCFTDFLLRVFFPLEKHDEMNESIYRWLPPLGIERET